ncbi:hypothetical protein JCM11641_007202 [Rhodosporidiobolus odoratus]
MLLVPHSSSCRTTVTPGPPAPFPPASLVSVSGKTPSTRSNSSGELDFDKTNKGTLKHLSQSRLKVDESVVRAEGEDRTTAFVSWLVIAARWSGTNSQWTSTKSEI